MAKPTCRSWGGPQVARIAAWLLWHGFLAGAADVQAFTAETSFGPLRVHSFGRGGRFALALHGASDAREARAEWHSTAAALASAGYVVYCPDLYSLVGTRPGSATNEELTNLALQLLQHAAMDRFSLLLGSRWSGGVAARIAALLPNYVERMVLVAPVMDVGLTLIRDIDGKPFGQEVSCETAVLDLPPSSREWQVLKRLLRREVRLQESAESAREAACSRHSDEIVKFAQRPPVRTRSVPATCSRLRTWKLWQDAGAAPQVKWSGGRPSGWAEPGTESAGQASARRLAELVAQTERSCEDAGPADFLSYVQEQDASFELLRVDAKSAAYKSLLLHGVA